MNFKKYLKELLLCINLILLIGLYCIVGYYYFCDNEEKTNEVINNAVSFEADISVERKKYVEIKGAVQNPGVFEINDETIVNDIVLLAGGFDKNAYTNNINLSKKLSDEAVIYVYTKYEYSNLNKTPVKEVIVEKECVCPEIDISSCVSSGASIIESNKVQSENKIEKEEIKQDDNTLEESEKLESSLVNINTATKGELITLNGVGESKAEKIIEYRNQHGNFSNIEDIKLVSGISDAIFEKIKDSITV